MPSIDRQLPARRLVIEGSRTRPESCASRIHLPVSVRQASLTKTDCVGAWSTKETMPSKLMPFDPMLGKKFAEEFGSFIVGVGRARPVESDEEMPPGLDAQQQHDWLMAHPGAKDPTLDDDE